MKLVSGSQGAVLGHSVQLLSVSRGATRSREINRFGSRLGLVDYMVGWGVMGRSVCRRLVYYLTNTAEVGRRVAQGLPQGLDPRAWAVQLGPGHSPISPLCAFAVCFSESCSGHWGCMHLGGKVGHVD